MFSRRIRQGFHKICLFQFLLEGGKISFHILLQNMTITTLSISSFPWHFRHFSMKLFYPVARQSRNVKFKAPSLLLLLLFLSGEKGEVEEGRTSSKDSFVLLPFYPVWKRVRKAEESYSGFFFFSSFSLFAWPISGGGGGALQGGKERSGLFFWRSSLLYFVFFYSRFPLKDTKNPSFFCWAGRDFFPFYILISLFCWSCQDARAIHGLMWGHLPNFVSTYWRANKHISIRKIQGLNYRSSSSPQKKYTYTANSSCMINHWAGPGGLFFPLLEALPSFAFQKRRRKKRSHFFPFSHSIFFPWRSVECREGRDDQKNGALNIFLEKIHILSNWKTLYYMKVSFFHFDDFLEINSWWDFSFLYENRPGENPPPFSAPFKNFLARIRARETKRSTFSF